MVRVLKDHSHRPANGPLECKDGRTRRRRNIMVSKWFPAAVAAVFIGPALAVAQAPGVPTVELVGAAPTPSVQSPQAPVSGAPVPVSAQPVAAPLDPVPAPPAVPPVPTGRGLTLLGMVIVPDRSDRPVIQSVVAGSPAAQAGMRED